MSLVRFPVYCINKTTNNVAYRRNDNLPYGSDRENTEYPSLRLGIMKEAAQRILKILQLLSFKSANLTGYMKILKFIQK